MLAFLSFVAPERQEQAKRTTNTSFTFIIRTQRSLIELYKQTNKQVHSKSQAITNNPTHVLHNEHNNASRTEF